MALQVLRVEVSLITVRAGEFAIGVLGRDGGTLRGTIDTVGHRSRAARDTGQDATAALRAHDLRAWLFLGVGRAVRAIHIRCHSPTLTIRIAESTGGETIEVRATVAWGSRSDRLRVALSGGCGREHARGRWGVLLVRLCLRVRKV
jgi:hypothetical protein